MIIIEFIIFLWSKKLQFSYQEIVGSKFKIRLNLNRGEDFKWGVF